VSGVREHRKWKPRQRWIKPNKCSHLPRRICFIETLDDYHDSRLENFRSNASLRNGMAVCGRLDKGSLTCRQSLVFPDAKILWAWLFQARSKRNVTYVFARHTFHVLSVLRFWTLFDERAVELAFKGPKRTKARNGEDNQIGHGLFSIEIPPTIICVRHLRTGAKYVFIDPINFGMYFKDDLLSGHNANDMDDAEDSGQETSEEETLATRIEHVSTSVLEYINWLKRADLGKFDHTVASQAKRAWRHGRYNGRVYISSEEKPTGLGRDAFFGGLREVYRWGKYKERCYKVDVTSLFPSVMENGLFPRRLIRYQERDIWCQFPPEIVLDRSVAEVRLNSPIEPFQHRGEYGVCWVLGDFDTILCGPELRRAYELGIITHWGSWAEYEVDLLFQRFVRDLWKERVKFRNDLNKPMELCCKLMMNGLFGKFAQKSPRWEDRPDIAPLKPWYQWPHISACGGPDRMFRSIGYHTQEKMKPEEGKESFPLISAFVTAYARETMRKLRLVAGIRGTLYQGIDSLILTSDAFDRLVQAGQVHPFQLGVCRLVGSSEGCTIHATGGYEFAGQMTYCGVPVNAIIKSDGSWDVKEFDGAYRLFKNNPTHEIGYTIRQKRFLADFNKGLVGLDGWVTPHEVNDVRRD